ncbi:MAG TPA: transporter [Anaeromyxobacteraceae bacterium]|jgi:hypothetical protein|nr:transporter [Anaeromyxobacteraceae bacterium]
MACRPSLGLLAAVLALGAPRAARACSVCGCGDPQLEANDPAATSGRFRLQLESQYLTVTSGTEGAPGLTDHLTQYTLRADAVYGPTDRLSLMVQVPLVRKELSTTGQGADRPTSSLSGLGDVELGARYSLFSRVDFGRRQRQELAVSAGTSLPTGANDGRMGGARVDEHGQVGTGSFGPYAGLHYAFSRGDWDAFATLSLRAHTTSSFGYQYGQALLWSLHAQYQAAPRLVLSAGIDGRNAWADLDHGAAVDDTGGLLLAAAPAAWFNVAGGFWLGARAQLPFYSRLRGEQSVGPTVMAGLQYQLF